MNHCGLTKNNLKIVRFGFRPLSYLSESTLNSISSKLKFTEKYKKRVICRYSQSTSIVKLDFKKKNIKLFKYTLKSCLINL